MERSTFSSKASKKEERKLEEQAEEEGRRLLRQKRKELREKEQIKLQLEQEKEQARQRRLQRLKEEEDAKNEELKAKKEEEARKAGESALKEQQQLLREQEEAFLTTTTTMTKQDRRNSVSQSDLWKTNKRTGPAEAGKVGVEPQRKSAALRRQSLQALQKWRGVDDASLAGRSEDVVYAPAQRRSTLSAVEKWKQKAEIAVKVAARRQSGGEGPVSQSTLSPAKGRRRSKVKESKFKTPIVPRKSSLSGGSGDGDGKGGGSSNDRDRTATDDSSWLSDYFSPGAGAGQDDKRKTSL